ncbi:MAG: hypothetical protein GXO10_04745 [Crenarchaeota archaeon]|nr:hypothetical protein [Thermoproteota archaeon]
MRVLRNVAAAGVAITVLSIVAICVLNLQYLYSLLQSLVPTGCIDAHIIGVMYSFDRSAVLTWTLICVIFLIIDLLLALAVKGAADRGERSAAVKLSAAYVGVSAALLFVTYLTYRIIDRMAYMCTSSMIRYIGLGNIFLGLIVLASAVACICVSVHEIRRASRPARLYRPYRPVIEEKPS